MNKLRLTLVLSVMSVVLYGITAFPFHIAQIALPFVVIAGMSINV